MVQTGHRALYEAKFSDNDSVLFTYTRNGEIHAWDVQTMKQMRTYIGHSGNLVKFFVAKDQLVSCSNNKVFFWNQQNSTVQKVITLFDSSGAFTLSTHWAKQYNENYLLVKQSVNFANTAIPKDYDIGWKINLTNGTRERIHSNVFEHLDYVDPNHALLLSTFIDYDNPDTTFFVLKETKPLQWDTVWKKKAHELQLGKFYNYYPQLTNDGAYVYFNNQAGINMNTHEITDTIHAYKFFSIDGKPHNLNEQSIFYWFKYGNKWVANMHHQWKLLEFKNAQLTAQLIPPVQLDTIFEIHNKINPLQWYSENNYSHNETKEYNLFVSHAMDKYVVTDPNQIALFNPFEKLIRSANFKVSRPTAIYVSNTGKQFLIEAENKGGNERKLWEWELGAAFPKEIFEFSNRIPDSINLRYNIRFSDTMIAGSKYKVELPKSWKLSYFRGIESILLFNQQTGDTIALEGHVGDVTQWAMNADETLLASVSLKDVNAVTSNDIKVWRIDKKIEWKRMLDLSFNFNEMGTSSEPISQLAFSKNNQYLWGAYKSKLVQWEINTGIPQLEINAFAPFHLSTGDSLIAATTSLGQDILIYDNVHQQNKWILSGHSSNITDLKFINNNQFLVSSSSDGKTKVWNVQTGKEILNIIQFQDGLSYAMLTPANYYFGSRESINELNFVVNNKAYGYEQFDLALNRPDIVLQQIDQKTNNKLALALEEAWKKRVRRTGISEIAASKIPDISSLPSIQLISNTTIEDKLFLTFAFKAASGKIKGYQIKINSIPAYTGNGKMIGTESRDNLFYDTVRLSEGNNYIQLFCFDENGMESLRQELTIEKNQSTSIASKRIFIGIGISTYQDAAYNLVYPDKDVEDLGRTFTIGNSLNTAEPFYNPLYQKIILKNDGASKAKVKA
ncbi:MAG: WD40 repeat domain-containing protein, partial [Ferruginibacter sp.]